MPLTPANVIADHQSCLAETCASGYNRGMENVVKQFDSFSESDKAARRYYRSLTPAQRLEILLDLISRGRDDQHEASKGFERVYRVVELGER